MVSTDPSHRTKVCLVSITPPNIYTCYQYRAAKSLVGLQHQMLPKCRHIPRISRLRLLSLAEAQKDSPVYLMRRLFWLEKTQRVTKPTSSTHPSAASLAALLEDLAHFSGKMGSPCLDESQGGVSGRSVWWKHWPVLETCLVGHLSATLVGPCGRGAAIRSTLMEGSLERHRFAERWWTSTCNADYQFLFFKISLLYKRVSNVSCFACNLYKSGSWEIVHVEQPTKITISILRRSMMI